MRKFWLVFINEYKRHVLRKRFIFAVLSMPVFFVLLVLIGFLSVWVQYNQMPVGFIASTDQIKNPQAVPAKSGSILQSVEFIRYTDENSAQEDIHTGKIQAYFVLSPDYLKNGEVTLIKSDKTGSNIESDFEAFLKYNLLIDKPENITNRLIEGTHLIVRSADGSRELAVDNWMAILLPLLAGILFIIAVNISGGYLLQAVVEEKENRTMEMVVTSVSPSQLMAGKVIGDLLVGITELAAWLAFAFVAINLVPNWLPIGQSVNLNGSSVWLIIAIYIPAFVLIAAAMGAIGATATESREAQQVASLFTLPIMIPFWFVTAIIFDPNGGIATGLSMFPLTAPIAMPLRAVFTTVPDWQIIVTIVVLDLMAVLTIWLAGRIFRIGMLQYGKRVTLREIFRKNALPAGQK